MGSVNHALQVGSVLSRHFRIRHSLMAPPQDLARQVVEDQSTSLRHHLHNNP